MAGIEFEDDYTEGDSGLDAKDFGQAVLAPTDWTVETIISQLEKGNIELTPKFQRRDAWSNGRKSRLVESMILGLPVPQIVLAESAEQRGRFIVLDGKQRLISLFHFASLRGDGYALSGLEIRSDLKGKKFKDFQKDPALGRDLDAFLNYAIRTAVIRNWPSTDFLHTVFLRLNTGSVKLSPQELRQAMFHGEFSSFVDDRAVESEFIKTLFHSKKTRPKNARRRTSDAIPRLPEFCKRISRKNEGVLGYDL